MVGGRDEVGALAVQPAAGVDPPDRHVVRRHGAPPVETGGRQVTADRGGTAGAARTYPPEHGRGRDRDQRRRRRCDGRRSRSDRRSGPDGSRTSASRSGAAVGADVGCRGGSRGRARGGGRRRRHRPAREHARLHRPGGDRTRAGGVAGRRRPACSRTAGPGWRSSSTARGRERDGVAAVDGDNVRRDGRAAGRGGRVPDEPEPVRGGVALGRHQDRDARGRRWTARRRSSRRRQRVPPDTAVVAVARHASSRPTPSTSR